MHSVGLSRFIKQHFVITWFQTHGEWTLNAINAAAKCSFVACLLPFSLSQTSNYCSTSVTVWPMRNLLFITFSTGGAKVSEGTLINFFFLLSLSAALCQKVALTLHYTELLQTYHLRTKDYQEVLRRIRKKLQNRRTRFLNLNFSGHQIWPHKIYTRWCHLQLNYFPPFFVLAQGLFCIKQTIQGRHNK